MTRYEIWQKVEAENARSKAKYGSWVDLPRAIQKQAIEGEIKEWRDAYDLADVHGEHGELVEAIQVINCMVRRIQHLTGEADA